MNQIYHYTKGYNLYNILMSQVIETENNSGVRLDPSITNFAWFTGEDRFPRTALPFVPEMPETNLQQHLFEDKPHVDMLKVAGYVGGIWRFALLRSNHQSIQSWIGSYQRKKLLKTRVGQVNEMIAKKAGDQQAVWFISSKPVSIANMVLQQLTPRGWVDRAHFMKENGSLLVADLGGADLSKIMTDSLLQRMKMNMPVPENLLAA